MADPPFISSPIPADPREAGSSRLSKPTKKATVEELRASLAGLGLETKGKKETLWRRSCKAYIQSTSRPPEFATGEVTVGGQQSRSNQKFKSFLCFDVEATCRAGKGDFDYPNEIIEFPVILLRWVDNTMSKLEQVDFFHAYVRPVWRPILSDFCVSLTGISQAQIDSALTFPEVLIKLEAWLDEHGLREDDALRDAVWVTDGPWDLRDFVPKQLHITPPSPLRYPVYFTAPYLNIKQAVQTVLSETWHREQDATKHSNEASSARASARITTASLHRRKPKSDKLKGPDFYLTIAGQVEALKLGEFKGRQHSGLDDATNIARVLIAISERDILLEANARLPHPHSARRYPWMAEPGVVSWEEWMDDSRHPAMSSDGQKRQAKEERALSERTMAEDADGRIRAKEPLRQRNAGKEEVDIENGGIS